VSIDQ